MRGVLVILEARVKPAFKDELYLQFILIFAMKPSASPMRDPVKWVVEGAHITRGVVPKKASATTGTGRNGLQLNGVHQVDFYVRWLRSGSALLLAGRGPT